MIELAFYIVCWMMVLPILLTIAGVIVMAIILIVKDVCMLIHRAVTSPVTWMIVGLGIFIVSVFG